MGGGSSKKIIVNESDKAQKSLQTSESYILSFSLNPFTWYEALKKNFLIQTRYD